MTKGGGFVKVGKSLPGEQRDENKYISREFQLYGLELAEELGDMAHRALYIKLAKTTPRGYLESARSFVKDAYNAKSKGRLFMWKLKQIKDEKKKGKSS
jgi:hypothetical protein